MCPLPDDNSRATMRTKTKSSAATMAKSKSTRHTGGLLQVCNAIACLVIIAVSSTWCLKVDTVSQASLEKSGWRRVDTWPPATSPTTTTGRKKPRSSEFSSRESYELDSGGSPGTTSTNGSSRARLIEWDDDDAAAHNEHQLSVSIERNRVSNNNRSSPTSSAISTTTAATVDSKIPYNVDDAIGYNPLNSFTTDAQYKYLQRHHQRHTDSVKLSWLPDTLSKPKKNPKLNRLVFHGQVKHDNAKRVVDGMEFVIDTHNPTSINRLPSPRVVSIERRASPAPEVIREVDDVDDEDDGAESPTTTAAPATRGSSRVSKSSNEDSTRRLDKRDKNRKKGQEEQSGSRNKALYSPEVSSSSDWRPIVLVQRGRRSGKTSFERPTGEPLRSEKGELKPGNKTGAVKLDYKWKPLKSGKDGSSSSATIIVTTTTSTTTERPKTVDWVRSGSKSAEGRRQFSPRQNGVVYGRKSVASPYRYQPSPLSLEGPFEDDGIITLSRRANDEVKSETVKGAKADDSFDDAQLETESSPRRSFRGEDDEDDHTGSDPTNRPLTSSSDKWKPVETTTASPTLETTTILPPTTTTYIVQSTGNISFSANNSASNHEQRSASDLNYIYSSQPIMSQPIVSSPIATQQQPVQPASTGSSSYYSNYVIQPTVQQPALPAPSNQDQPVAPIVDTVSGQQPEMIQPDRDIPPPQPQPAPQSDYSLPQTMATFQPAARPPTVGASQPQSPSSSSHYGYGDYGHGGYSHHSHSRPTQQLREQTREQTPQVVRQEHHYHYYNSQQQPPQRSQLERQQTFSNPPVTQTIMRELQPLVLSQPIIQQAPPAPATTSTTTTTPAPQIIREIVREVPSFANIPNIQRLIVPQVPPIPIPILPPPPPIPLVQRDTPAALDTSGLMSLSTGYAPAQRIMRQITNSIPSVSIRVPQFKLSQPAPAPVAIPLRVAPVLPVRGLVPVTRHAGSYVIPSVPKQTTTYLTETQAMPSHTTILQTTQFTPASRTTVYTTDHQPAPQTLAAPTSGGYARSRR